MALSEFVFRKNTRKRVPVQGTCGWFCFLFSKVIYREVPTYIHKYAPRIKYSVSTVSKRYTWQIKFSKTATAAQRPAQRQKKGRRKCIFHHFPTIEAWLYPSVDWRVKHKDMNDSTSGFSTSLYMYLLYQRELQRQVRAPIPSLHDSVCSGFKLYYVTFACWMYSSED